MTDIPIVDKVLGGILFLALGCAVFAVPGISDEVRLVTIILFVVLIGILGRTTLSGGLWFSTQTSPLNPLSNALARGLPRLWLGDVVPIYSAKNSPPFSVALPAY